MLVTGASGFVGRAVLRELGARRLGPVVAPSSSEFDLTRHDDVATMFDAFRPRLVIHLAERLWAGSAPIARIPADFIETCTSGSNCRQARRSAVENRHGRLDLHYPKFTPVPF